ncbi:PRAME family member 18-like [Dipodomys spectabilis]|uniref:PRAME family member 18-like n=1 Tax=Dipodomys spectabilis TaxID=105255 RepID=UPI001C54658A|nr:PRAME family member 18-like [Dipodomys spectabilis]
MGDQAPPTLVQLAAQKLLENQALAISALEDLPCHVFPLLFFEAFKKKHSKLLKAMVQAWPFPCLPRGALSEDLEFDTLEIGLDGLDMLLVQKDWSRPSPCSSSTLSTMSLPTLRQLAMQSLLEDQALAMSALDVLPLDLFSTLCREVVAKRRMEVLKAMVQAWPFACLPVGALVGSADLEILQVTLEGLDVLLEQGVGPRCKLQVLDLQNMSLNIWTSGYIAMSQACSAAALTDKPAANHCAALRKEPSFRIFMDVTISDGPWDCVLAHVLQWAETRRDQVQLCSKKLQIGMKYSASRFKISFFIQLLQQRNLQQIYMYRVYFLYGNLHKVFRTLKPLTTLSLSSRPLNEADLKCLSLCPCTSQLKHLRLRTIYLGQWSPGPLRALLERVSGTLEALAIEHCGITEAQLSAILPALSQCSQLSFFSIYGNRMSLAALQNLLSHTAKLRQLQRGLYPAPVESYDHECLLYGCEVNKENFVQVCVSLVQILRDLQPAHKVQICTYTCVSCKKNQFYSLAPSGNWVVTEEYSFTRKSNYCGVCQVH